MHARSTERPARKSLFRRLVLIFVKTVLTVVIIVLLIFFLLQTPYVQDIVRSRAENYLARKLQTRVRIGHLAVTFFRSVTLKDVYIEDRHRDTLLSAGLIDIRVRMLGLLHHELDIRRVTLSGLTAKVLRYSPDTGYNYQFIIDAFAGKPSAVPDTAKSQPFGIALHELALNNIRLVYGDSRTGDTATVAIGHSLTRMEGIDVDSERFRVGSFDMQRTALAYRSASTGMAASTEWRSIHADDVALDLHRMIYRARRLQLDSVGLGYDDNRQPRQKKGMDYAHLLVRGLTLHGEDLVYTPDSSSGRITKGELAERSGFRLTRLQTHFFYSGRRIALRDLLLQTPGSLLQRAVSLRCDSLAGIMKSPAHTLIALDMPASRIRLSDVLVFAPSLASQPAFRRPGETWQLDTRMDGSLDALTIRTLQFGGAGDIRADLSGRLLHLLDARRFEADLGLRDLSGSRAALIMLLPAGTLPHSVGVPARFDLRGRVAGGRDGLDADLDLYTSSGSVRLKGFAHHVGSTSGAVYDVHVAARGLDLGAILRDSAQYGRVTADVAVKGVGLDIHTANAQWTAIVHSAVVRRYAYHELSVEGSLHQGNAELRSAIDDPAVRFRLRGAARIAGNYPAIRLDWQVDTLDLHAIGLTTDTLRFKGQLSADFQDTNPDSLEGSLRLSKMDVVRGRQHIVTDSVMLLADRRQDIEHIQLHTEMADLDLSGHYLLTQMPVALEHTIAEYYRPGGFRDTANFTSEDWTLRMQLRTSPLLLSLMPTLRGSDSVGGTLTYNSDRNELHLGLGAPRLVLGTQFLHDIHIAAGTGDSSLRYDISLGDGHGSGLLLYKTAVYGVVRENRVKTTLLLKDKNNKDRYRLAGSLDQQNGALKFSVDPDSLLLNYDSWQVSRDNFIEYDPTGVVAHDLTISNGMDSLSLNSKGVTGAAPLDIRFGSFRLSTLSRLANQDSVIADGVLNGTAEVKNVTKSPVFTADMKIANLSYKTDTLGDLTLKVNNEKANAFTADIGLQGKNNDITMAGDYYTAGGRMDLKLDLRRINLAAFSGAVQGTIDKMKGYMRGQLTVTGTFDKPNIRGDLSFDSTVITPTISGEPLDVSRDRIAFDEDGFNFSDFTLKDSAGNKLVLDGNVFTKDYHSFAFDISLDAQNFRMINAPEDNSRPFYGQLNLDAAINLEGKMEAPKVDGTIRVNQHTNFYYVLPASNPEVSDRIGVVRFVDHRTGDTLVDRKALSLQGQKTEIKGLDVSLNLITDTSAVLNVVIDPSSGDALNVRGRSTLVFQLEKSGKMDLTGSYTVNGGYYSLSFDVLKRKFNIDPGSVVTWAGDPTQATVNLTASYTANTPSIDLVSNVISDLPQVDQNKFRQKLPFLVTLKMDGDLLKPGITFDISLPSTILTLWPEVDQRLTELRTQQSEMNEQVFALLLLGRFVGQNPLNSEAGGGSTVGNLAFSSASQILTNQMDQVAASLIKAVDINFDLNNQQDWSTGTEIDYTELDVTVSKQLMQDRLRVSVGSSFDVVGTGAPQQAPSNLAGTVDAYYKLSKDGRYLLRVYRQNQYEAVVEGQVIETGVGFLFIINYDRFKEIWRRAKGDAVQARKTSNSSTTSK